jgi:hypothetical protein
MALIDGELPRPRSDKSWAHLAKCPACKPEMQTIERGLKRFHNAAEDFELASPPSLADGPGLASLLNAIRSWNEANPGADATRMRFTGSPLYDALAKELELYIGAPTARELLDKCCDAELTSTGLAMAVEPVVSGFLGHASGLAVVAKLQLIWNRLHPDPLTLGLPS